MPAKKREVRIRPLAEADLEEIWLYTFERWSSEQADKYVGDLIATMDLLALGNKTGRPCSVRDGYFQYAIGAHILFFLLTPAVLEITRILHQRMDVERYL